MSEHHTLADSDARPRWAAFARHQVVLVALATGLAADVLLRSGALPLEAPLALGLAAGAVPLGTSSSVGEWMVASVRYVRRAKWSRLTCTVAGDEVTVAARTAVTFRSFELDQRGRLDLTGRDLDVVAQLRDTLDTLARRGASSHVSCHVRMDHDLARTFVALDSRTPAPPGWRPDDSVVRAEFLNHDELVVLERRTYVRTTDGVARTIRVRSFGHPRDRAALAALQFTGVTSTLSWHAHVLPSQRAERITGRAVHRLGTDAVAAHALGFRRSAGSALQLRRTQQREQLVASGRGLLRVGVYLTVRAPTTGHLRRAMKVVRVKAREGGLLLDEGAAHQAQWHRWQLPGGVDW